MLQGLTVAEASTWGSMALSVVLLESSGLDPRVAAWQKASGRLGVRVPLFLIHDLGVLLSLARGVDYLILERREVLRHLGSGRLEAELLAQYRALLDRLAELKPVRRLGRRSLSDSVIGLLIARALRLLYIAWLAEGEEGFEGLVELSRFPEDPREQARAFALGFLHSDRGRLLAFCKFVCERQSLVFGGLEQMEAEAGRLFTVSPAASGAGPEQLADLWRILVNPELGGVVSFSMELLPSLGRLREGGAEQLFGMDGYEGLLRDGSPDGLLPIELAHDREVFLQKVLDRDLFFYSHPRQRPEEGRLFYLLVDSSASMRGRRATFAKALGLGLGMRLLRKGHSVWFRYFDARLHRLFMLSERDARLPSILAYPCDGSRNYERCFEELLGHLRHAAPGRRAVELIWVTHHECSFSTGLARRLRGLARLTSIVLLPSRSGSEAAVWKELDQVRIIREPDLLEGQRRLEAARSILAEY